MKTAIPKPSKQSIIREARDYVMIAIGMILYGIGWTVFLLPNDITTGGVPGIASIVYWATGFPVQYTYFSINFFLLLLALKLLGMKFCIKTIFGVFTLTFFLSVIQKLTAGFGLLHDQPFMACVIGASFCGGGIPGHHIRKSRTHLRYDYYFFQLFCLKRLGKSGVWVCNSLYL